MGTRIHWVLNMALEDVMITPEDEDFGVFKGLFWALALEAVALLLVWLFVRAI